ncbi:ArsC/Spx/MgsR family protein [Lactococcus garvieae]|uniref:ArsC/Spx/MgsR family protein n=1 Tax=Lactococcus garvieae TaxID=1363 RepID=UPI0038529605
MIQLFYKQRCTSSIKAIQWFKKYGLEVKVRPSSQISREELITLLASTDNGFSDLIKNSNKIKREDLFKIELLGTKTVSQAIDYIKVNPDLLKSPIIMEKKKC